MTATYSGKTAASGGLARSTGGDTASVRRDGAVRLNSRRAVLFLLATALVLAAFGAFANLVIYQIADSPEADLARIMKRFDLGHEPSLPAWFSSLLLLLNSAMLLLISRVKKRAGDAYANHWLVLGLIFLCLSIDESVMFHEMIDKSIHFAHETSGFLLFPWVIVGALFALAVFVGYWRFLLHLPRATALLFVLSGGIYLAGAVGMEVMAAAVIDRYGVASVSHTIVQTIEESLEMFGAILFFYCLTEFWKRSYGPLQFGSSESAPW